MSPADPLRVTLLTTSLMRSGAEVQVFLLAKTLRGAGHDVDVVSMRDPEAYAEDLTQLGIPLLSLGMTRGVPDPRALLSLVGHLRRRQPQVLHSHMVHANLLGRVARWFVPLPVQVSTAHSLTEGARWREIAYRLTDPWCDLTTNVSQAAVDRYIRVGAVPPRKIVAMPNGAEIEAFRRDVGEGLASRARLGVEAEDYLWLAVGRLDVAKDYPNLLQAMKLLGASHPRARLLLVGDGPELSALQDLGRSLGLAEPQLRFLGARSDIAALMSAADSYVMSSAWEGLPMVLIEAAAASLPAVATDVGGNAEVVLHDRTGILVPSQDPSALAEAMGRVMDMSSASRAAWGEEARRHADAAFHIDRVVERWVALYRRLVNGERP